MLVFETGADNRCRSVTYDTQFDELPLLETVDVGTPTSTSISGTGISVTCGAIALSTGAVYDRGLGVVTKVTQPDALVTTAAYDGFGRITDVFKPDPANIGSPSSTASSHIDYYLPTDATKTPYTIVHTQTLDGPNSAGSPTVSSPKDAWAFADGLGRRENRNLVRSPRVPPRVSGGRSTEAENPNQVTPPAVREPSPDTPETVQVTRVRPHPLATPRPRHRHAPR